MSITQYKDNLEEIMDLASLPEDKLLAPIQEGKWSIKEIIGHIFYWDKFILEEMVPHMEQGGVLIAFPDHDLHNHEAVKYITNFQVQEVFEQFANTRNELLDKVSLIPNDVRFTIGKGKRKFSTDSFLKMFVSHDQTHVKQIYEFLEMKK